MAVTRRIKRRETLTLIAVLTIVPVAGAYAILECQHWYRYAMHNRAQTPSSIGPESPPGTETFAPGRAVPEQPAITNIDIVTAEQAGTRVDDDEMVIGVVIDGTARAYPLNMMTEFKREVFNDELAGRPIAATW